MIQQLWPCFWLMEHKWSTQSHRFLLLGHFERNIMFLGCIMYQPWANIWWITSWPVCSVPWWHGRDSRAPWTSSIGYAKLKLNIKHIVASQTHTLWAWNCSRPSECLQSACMAQQCFRSSSVCCPCFIVLMICKRLCFHGPAPSLTHKKVFQISRDWKVPQSIWTAQTKACFGPQTVQYFEWWWPYFGHGCYWFHHQHRPVTNKE